MTHILAFDTSSNSCSVAINKGQEVLYSKQELAPSVQAERLMVMVEDALKETKLSYNDIDYLAVTIGPGSFTGIRIGLAAAKGLLYASKMKPIGIDNFESAHYRLAQQVTHYDSGIIILNAYRGQLYVAEFKNNGERSKPELINVAEIKNYLAKFVGLKALAGNGLAVIYDAVKEMDDVVILPRFPTVKAMHIARYADEKINKGTISPIEPLYIRPPDAVPPK